MTKNANLVILTIIAFLTLLGIAIAKGKDFIGYMATPCINQKVNESESRQLHAIEKSFEKQNEYFAAMFPKYREIKDSVDERREWLEMTSRLNNHKKEQP